MSAQTFEDDGPDDEDEEIPWVAHIEPQVHVEVDAEEPLDAQFDAMQRLRDALETAFEDTEMEVHEIHLDTLEPDVEAMMGGLGDAMAEALGDDDRGVEDPDSLSDAFSSDDGDDAGDDEDDETRGIGR